MRIAVWIACLWPGLAQAWLLGSSRGVTLAICFAGALNMALMASFVWPRWPVEGAPAGLTAVVAWSLVLGLLVLGWRSVGRDWSKLSPRAARRDDQIDVWFCDAQNEYLKGHWIAAEALLNRLLAKAPHDFEARLLLCSVQRRSRQWSQAKRTLNELSQQPQAGRWQLEIGWELKQITDMESEAGSEPTSGESSLRNAA